jgi:hypothetical protein
MNLSRNTTIILIIILILVGIGGTYYIMGWLGIGNFYSKNQVSYSDNDLKEYISDFIERELGSGYQVSDIFVFSNSPYYISVVEKDTGKGAIELLFDPDGRSFQPEPGPNMMWNQKYGMMGRNWMGLNQLSDNGEFTNINQVSRNEALEYAREYLTENAQEIEVSTDGHEFYGYYTFHTTRDNKPYGMLSVNGINGDVWYHDWHGDLKKIIEMEEHDEDGNHEKEEE